MAVTITHTAVDHLGAVAPSATVSIDECDEYGELVSPPTYGPYTPAAAGDGTWSQSVQQSTRFRASETSAGGAIVFTFVLTPAAGGPYDLAAIAFTPTDSVDTAAALQEAAAPLVPLGAMSTSYVAGVPGHMPIALDTFAAVTGTDYWVPMLATTPVEITGMSVEIASAPGATRKVRVAIHRSELDWSVGAQLYESGEQTISSAYFGTFTWGGDGDAFLPAGRYWLGFCVNGNLSVKRRRGPSLAGVEQGADHLVEARVGARAFGAFADPYVTGLASQTTLTDGWSPIPLPGWRSA